MINKLQSNQNFGSIKLNTKGAKYAVSDITDAIESVVTVKGLGGISIDSARKSLKNSEAAFLLNKDGTFIVGEEKSIENYFFRKLQKVDKDAQYIDDAPEIISDMPEFKLDLNA